MSENPYPAPQTFDAPPTLDSGAEVTRKEHIKTEASIKSIGILCFLGSIVLSIVAARILTTPEYRIVLYGLSGHKLGIILIFLAVFQLGAGWSIRKFGP